jgi:hypothetical protein
MAENKKFLNKMTYNIRTFFKLLTTFSTAVEK